MKVEEVCNSIEKTHECVVQYTFQLMEQNIEPSTDYYRLIVSLETVYKKLNPDKKLELSVSQH